MGPRAHLGECWAGGELPADPEGRRLLRLWCRESLCIRKELEAGCWGGEESRGRWDGDGEKSPMGKERERSTATDHRDGSLSGFICLLESVMGIPPHSWAALWEEKEGDAEGEWAANTCRRRWERQPRSSRPRMCSALPFGTPVCTAGGVGDSASRQGALFARLLVSHVPELSV